MGALQNVLYFLVSTAFSLYIGAVIIRFLLAISRADFYNPISQAIVKITNPALVPMRRIVPAVGKLDTAAIALAVGLKIISVFILLLIKGAPADFFTVIIYAVANLIRTVVWIYMIALIVQAIMSWVGNAYGNPVATLLDYLTAPILQPIRQYVPELGGIDLSPLVAIIGLQVVLILFAGIPTI